MSPPDTPRVLQLCHGYDGPFLDCARQYAVLFAGTPYLVTTVFLIGVPDERVAAACASDEVLFLGYSSKELGGLKLGPIRRLREIIRGRDFRLCIAHRFKPTYIACVATHLPVIGVNHAFGVYQRLSRRMFANLFRKRLLLLGVSNAVRDDIRTCLPRWPAERTETLYNRIDIEAVQAEQLPRAQALAVLGLPSSAWVVGNVGRLHPDKDQATLIRGFAKALSNLPEGSVLVILGKGRLEAELKTLAGALGIAGQVHFLGQVAKARRYFNAFDVFALTSDHEPFGMVLLEAMAAGVPVIASDCGGGREVVGGVGTLFPLGDAAVLAEGLVRMSGLGAEQRSLCEQLLAQRLDEVFSDTAVRARFWQLDTVASLLKLELARGKYP
ncbi:MULTISPECIES: glycosyltransferase [Pseudomonadaceae]|uniref:glycosyltransferase n=1 Tax=Pseudomonadaceae TaxID=135621 RepID=UPI0015E3F540|nr:MULTISPECIES: glycosyltransferase [Pseudomonadaceae]MBA1276620.1 glycosyltransferase [Stutzerimonas stutzeri]MBC8649124.1 glycosyltransferase [Pseudomonas sp. MT4]QXY93082.1 glycosyltransferase [Pseudomonas sp. MTM4]